MIRSLRIRNFQSLRDVSMDPGAFTVVVGSTGSGKSSVIRALRLLFFNARGTSWISRGATSASVSASLPEGDVQITRGKGQDSYQVRTGDRDDDPYLFTKLGGTLPEKVAVFLRMAEDESGACLNFAGQFDVPYLLGSSGAQVARILGDLTNVNVLYGAAREAGRRRLALLGDLRGAEAEVLDLQERAQGFSDLRSQQEAVAKARKLLERIPDQKVSVATLGSVLLELAELERKLSRIVSPVLPDMTVISTLAARREALSGLVGELEGEILRLSEHGTAVTHLRRNADTLFDELQYFLAEAGTCPLCGQSVH